jgi:hypothetical protein
MARPTQYQKLSLQLDAENKKLKDKLKKTQDQIRGIKNESAKMGKGFGQSMDQLGGKAGQLKNQVSGLVNSIGAMNPAVLGLAGVGAAAGLAFQDLTAYTKTWEGSLSDAGREMAAVQTGFKTFIGKAAELRGKALAEGGIFGWIKEGLSQLTGLQTGATQAALGVQTAIASIVNDAMLEWQQSILDTTVKTGELRAETQELYNQFRDKALMPEDRLKAIDTFKSKALELFEIQKGNAEKELKFLEEQSKLQGNSFEDNLRIEQVKASIADLERQYQKMLGRTVEFQSSITNELKKQKIALVDFAQIYEDTFGNISVTNLLGDAVSGLDTQNMGFVDMFEMPEEKAEEFKNLVGEAQQEVTAGWMNMADVIGTVSTGIATAKDNWAAMAAVVLSGIGQIIPAIDNIVKATKVLMAAKQAEGVASAAAAGAGLPFPLNLAAIATGVATVISTIAPFVGSFARGTNYVARTGMAEVHQGEKILRKNQSMDGFGDMQLVASVSGDQLNFILNRYKSGRNNSL